MTSTKFDIAEYLEDDEMINEYLNTVLEEGDSNDIQVALCHIAKAIGMSKIAEQTIMSRPSLFKALSENAKPQFDIILRVLRSIRGNLKLKPSLSLITNQNKRLAPFFCRMRNTEKRRKASAIQLEKLIGNQLSLELGASVKNDTTTILSLTIVNK